MKLSTDVLHNAGLRSLMLESYGQLGVSCGRVLKLKEGLITEDCWLG
ncbi:hypothetical protein E4O03_09325 [Treponema sp. OMZ 792]|nr:MULTISPECIES: hypothetical protein [unclassified Treponema]UTC74415.1 hypothetical protein E4O03_09325 [Treponema sp. OMZ 792]UTC77307.1 hypothetical protein E4O04_04510 [Treponema sp. OMZ 799]UTC80811.1 hypothetical protein E4O07_09230 [Treponema sp. OMZ 798]